MPKGLAEANADLNAGELYGTRKSDVGKGLAPSVLYKNNVNIELANPPFSHFTKTPPFNGRGKGQAAEFRRSYAKNLEIKQVKNVEKKVAKSEIKIAFVAFLLLHFE